MGIECAQNTVHDANAECDNGTESVCVPQRSVDSLLHVVNNCSGQGKGGEDLEWPDGNGICEGCGRITYGCEAYGRSGVILCEHCRKAHAPTLLAAANHCFRFKSMLDCVGKGGS